MDYSKDKTPIRICKQQIRNINENNIFAQD